ncbi:ketopantoate reductase PanE/ApbA C terminal-domain-containing protein [Jimgerdemannia flammicorona]|uniref:Ketopantoate reductase PanE/ApbA C terminal-domain-containing protein n=1 Tax=Jimgerdemannia flammicorona TaxID=994334 RepID=A0A433Q4Z7_9FUNG|nr:ketopantoate reductase PanE/ApbA C terminal-domain-containing protein [Jimgerdemannia flammicorona]
MQTIPRRWLAENFVSHLAHHTGEHKKISLRQRPKVGNPQHRTYSTRHTKAGDNTAQMEATIDSQNPFLLPDPKILTVLNFKYVLDSSTHFRILGPPSRHRGRWCNLLMASLAVLRRHDCVSLEPRRRRARRLRHSLREVGQCGVPAGESRPLIQPPCTVVSSPIEAASNGDEFDYVVVTLKALPDVYDVAEIIRPAVTLGKTTIVLIQNGLGEGSVRWRAKAGRGRCRSRQGHTGRSVAEGGLGSELVWVYHLLPTSLVLSPRNGSFSPISMLTLLDTQSIINDPEQKALTVNLMRDVIRVAAANGYVFDEEATIADMFTKTARIAMGYKPSMLVDLEKNQPMEIEVILGNPWREAKAKGVEVPYLETLYTLCSAVNQREKRARERRSAQEKKLA